MAMIVGEGDGLLDTVLIGSPAVNGFLIRGIEILNRRLATAVAQKKRNMRTDYEPLGSLVVTAR